jgi:mannose-1-phosphate guanylyltransferase
LCGGAGTRLAPITAGTPKQFFQLKSGQTMLEITVKRLLPARGKIGLVLGSAHLKAAQALLKPQVDYLFLEPFSKNTAPAIAFTVLELASAGLADSTVIFIPCDQTVIDQALLLRSIEAATSLAQFEKLVLIGFKTQKPDTGLGYFLPAADGAAVSCFVEKPDLQTCTRMLQQGFLANGGIFVGKVQTFINVLEEFCPHLMELLKSERGRADAFAAIEPISFDHAVLQKGAAVLFVEAGCQIFDLGRVETFLEFEERL